PTGQSRIDQIWITNDIATQTTKTQIINTQPEFHSDHKIITLSLSNFLITKIPQTTPTTRFNYNKTTSKTWETINETIKHKLEPLHLDELDLQSSWKTFNLTLKETMNKHIPKTKIHKNTPQIFSKNGTILHKKLQKIKYFTYNLTTLSPLPTDPNLLKELQKLKLPYSNKQELTSSLKQLFKITYKTLKAENNLQKKETINNIINQRILNLQEKPKIMIQQTLNHKKPKASLIKIIDPIKEEIITDPHLIHQTITNHYKNVFRKRSIDNELLQKWNKYYTPLNNINPTIYDTLMCPITEYEISETINLLPNNKAPGLPNQSAFEPIQILNSIYNTKKLTQQELWILSLDISAAFDSVNLNMLKKSMHRLHIPETFITLSGNILTNRTCQIITDHGLTKQITIPDGIDQGETLSPLWWIIFYDPLITALTQQPSQLKHNTIAYMDDLNLLATSKTELQNNLNIATEFFLLNDIKANPTKTKLIVMNSKTTNKQIHQGTTAINPTHKKEPIRILGIWLSEHSILTPNRNKITEDSETIAQELKSKFTTGHMAAYIYNKVLLPRIEFKLQTTFLTPNMLKNTQRKIDTTIKYKFNIEKTLPQTWFYNPHIFNIKPINDLQNEAQPQYTTTSHITKTGTHLPNNLPTKTYTTSNNSSTSTIAKLQTGNIFQLGWDTISKEKYLSGLSTRSPTNTQTQYQHHHSYLELYTILQIIYHTLQSPTPPSSTPYNHNYTTNQQNEGHYNLFQSPQNKQQNLSTTTTKPQEKMQTPILLNYHKHPQYNANPTNLFNILQTNHINPKNPINKLYSTTNKYHRYLPPSIYTNKPTKNPPTSNPKLS
ncbi:3866_t:CDS:2, partial [Dentiscutata heterogama]